jgi:hypothetical protein
MEEENKRFEESRKKWTEIGQKQANEETKYGRLKE